MPGSESLERRERRFVWPTHEDTLESRSPLQPTWLQIPLHKGAGRTSPPWEVFSKRFDRCAPSTMKCIVLLLAAWLLLPSPARGAANPLVRFDVPNIGHFDVELCQAVSSNCVGAAPNTVAYFLNYVNQGAYLNLGGKGPSSFVQRSITSFVIQGGGYLIHDIGNGLGYDCVEDPNPGLQCLLSDPAIANEFNQSNRRGTVALARIPGQPDSGTSQWFVNLDDNGGPPNNLDTTDGGFTVFGVVVGDGMQVADAIGALPVSCLVPDPSDPTMTQCDPHTDLDSVPLLNFPDPCGGAGQPACDPLPYLVHYSVPEPPALLQALAALGALAAQASTIRWRHRP